MGKVCGLAAVSLLAVSCSAGRPAAVTAAEVERVQCDGSMTADGELRLLRSIKVLDVEPLFSFSHSSYMHGEERLVGAKLLIRPPAGTTAETLTRILQCRNARLLLGQGDVSAAGHDPYSLPNAWVNVEVTSENGNFAVALTAESFRDNLTVLDRAKTYAEDHMLASEGESP
ncbi:MAG TPA: hypothetical protein VEK07_04475 [Polyangiaceae bacterium]|nr:hypothetical protein [Polyangiaceae bacterium]